MDHAPQIKQPRRFHLVRNEDFTGISGTGIVAQGLEFPNGYCLMRWVVPPAQSMVIYETVAELISIHGHGGRTVVDYFPDIAEETDHLLSEALEASVLALSNLTKLALSGA